METPRRGEICNACVLLVKRFKRLPPDSNRNWGHVVDARVGPGLKSMTKFKKRKEEMKKNNKNGGTDAVAQNGQGSSTLKTANGGVVNGASQPAKSSTTVSERFGKIFKKKKKLISPPVRVGTPGNLLLIKIIVFSFLFVISNKYFFYF